MTTATTTDNVDQLLDQAARNVAKANAYVAEHMHALPTVEELATPIVTTIYALHDLQDLSWYIEFLTTDAAARAGELLAVVDDVALIVEAVVDQCILHDDRPLLAGRVRALVYALSGAEGLRSQYHGARAAALVDR